MSQLWDFNVIYVPFGTWRTGVSKYLGVVKAAHDIRISPQVSGHFVRSGDASMMIGLTHHLVHDFELMKEDPSKGTFDDS